MGSEGGDWTCAAGIVDLISGSENYINTYAMGEVCSSASMIWTAGDARALSNLSVLMYHNGTLHPPEDKVESIMRVAEVTQRMCEDTYTFLSERSNKPPGYFKDKLTGDDWWVFPDELIKIGLATEIGTP